MAGIAAAVLVMLVLLLVLIGLLLQPFITLPAGVVLGTWLLLEGLGGLRDGKAMAGMVATSVGSAVPAAPALIPGNTDLIRTPAVDRG